MPLLSELVNSQLRCWGVLKTYSQHISFQYVLWLKKTLSDKNIVWTKCLTDSPPPLNPLKRLRTSNESYHVLIFEFGIKANNFNTHGINSAKSNKKAVYIYVHLSSLYEKNIDRQHIR